MGFTPGFEDFREPNNAVKEQFTCMGLQENMQYDQQNWSELKETVFCDFIKQADV